MEGSQSVQGASQEIPCEQGSASGHTAAVKLVSAKGKESATEAMLPFATTAGNHFHKVAICLDSGEIEVVRYDGEAAEQASRIAVTPCPCTECKAAGVICTGPTVGRCARCSVRRRACSNAGPTAKGQASQSRQERRKRKRDEVAPPARPHVKIFIPATRSTSPRSPSPPMPTTREIDDAGCLGPLAEADTKDLNESASKRHCAASLPTSECSISTPPCPTSAHVSKRDALQCELTELLTRMHELVADVQQTATSTQSKAHHMVGFPYKW